MSSTVADATQKPHLQGLTLEVYPSSLGDAGRTITVVTPDGASATFETVRGDGTATIATGDAASWAARLAHGTVATPVDGKASLQS